MIRLDEPGQRMFDNSTVYKRGQADGSDDIACVVRLDRWFVCEPYKCYKRRITVCLYTGMLVFSRIFERIFEIWLKQVQVSRKFT